METPQALVANVLQLISLPEIYLRLQRTIDGVGQIVEVGGWVIETALKQMMLWMDQGLVAEDFMLCINISPRQFRDAQFAENIHRQLARVNVPSQNIMMEVTEHNIIHNLDDAILRMKELIHSGISFSLDDFWYRLLVAGTFKKSAGKPHQDRSLVCQGYL